MRSVRIPLHSRKYPDLFTIIDEDDIELANQYRWNPFTRSHGTYAIHSDGKHSVWLHRLIVGAAKGEIVDHINGDGLDNRKCNLRICTGSQNHQNKHVIRNATGYRGVYFHRQSGKYQAQIVKNYRNISCGYYDTPEEAARARDRATLEHYGPFALNFPEEGEA